MNIKQENTDMTCTEMIIRIRRLDFCCYCSKAAVFQVEKTQDTEPLQGTKIDHYCQKCLPLAAKEWWEWNGQ